MRWLGLEKDLPGLVTFEERLEGGEKVRLADICGKTELNGRNRQHKGVEVGVCMVCPRTARGQCGWSSNSRGERKSIVRISFYSKAIQ